jgi:hypothetical protein
LDVNLDKFLLPKIPVAKFAQFQPTLWDSAKKLV